MWDRRAWLIVFGWYTAGVVLGCLLMNLMWQYGSVFLLNERKLALSLLEDNVTYIRFWNTSLGILCVFLYALLIGSAFTRLGVMISNGFCFAAGIWCGAFCTEGMIVKGLNYILLIGRLIFPECVLYLAAYSFGIIFVYKMSIKQENRRKLSGKKQWNIWKNLVWSILFFVCWGIKEYYVNYGV